MRGVGATESQGRPVGLVLAAQAVVIAVLSYGFALAVVATHMIGPPGTEPSVTGIRELPLGWGVFAFVAESLSSRP